MQPRLPWLRRRPDPGMQTGHHSFCTRLLRSGSSARRGGVRWGAAGAPQLLTRAARPAPGTSPDTPSRMQTSNHPWRASFIRWCCCRPRCSEAAATLAAVLAHEHEHIARRDNLKAHVHQLVEILFWFHPLVWFIGRKQRDERERACDEAVLARGHDPVNMQAASSASAGIAPPCIPATRWRRWPAT